MPAAHTVGYVHVCQQRFAALFASTTMLVRHGGQDSTTCSIDRSCKVHDLVVRSGQSVILVSICVVSHIICASHVFDVRGDEQMGEIPQQFYSVVLTYSRYGVVASR